ncbi:hypothetical protein [Chryseobacterium fistulae]|uniref:Uncharacterized protein n=1 Tax=Chryseobacterium fistulae TaxID=2675058 RepID=A0A6N4Y0X1_9FLAO|nr:hypothetical protein [Chryseobacterium fistulae]CAA7393227.1 hypothetical protein CHRY9393_03478 [Chryseobacterium fistulae]
MKKKTIEPEKKLSLKKLQIMKISEMRVISGGSNQLNMNGDVEPPTQVPQGSSISVRN